MDVTEDQAGDRLLWAEDIAALTGIKLRVIHRMANSARRAAETGKTRATHLPLPVDRVKRKINNGHHEVTVTSSRWRESEITAWLANRPGRGNLVQPSRSGEQ
jgi:predicted DNA-binding transcriptional regulator AlpA